MVFVITCLMLQFNCHLCAVVHATSSFLSMSVNRTSSDPVAMSKYQVISLWRRVNNLHAKSSRHGYAFDKIQEFSSLIFQSKPVTFSLQFTPSFPLLSNFQVNLVVQCMIQLAVQRMVGSTMLFLCSICVINIFKEKSLLQFFRLHVLCRHLRSVLGIDISLTRSYLQKSSRFLQIFTQFCQ